MSQLAYLQPDLEPQADTVDAAAAMRGVFAITDTWGLNTREVMAILGHPARATFFNWKGGRVKGVPHDTLMRIGYVAGIFKALQILYSDPALADRWLRQPNAGLDGHQPLDLMTGDTMIGLARVRAYLDAARGPWG
ncbi:MAG: MbcA/ParS/Xre antitoxin family protein [Pseudomonadota bacterium]